jgi:TPR repeat
VYNKQEKFEAASVNLEKALTLKANFPAANYELGVAYNGQGMIEEARNQLTLLNSSDFNLATDLRFLLNKPRMIVMDSEKSGGFSEILGPRTPLWMLDPINLLQPNTSKTFSVAFQFTNDMDLASITNTQNWSISRANSPDAGYYNNTMPLTQKDIALPSAPEAIFYNPITREATIKFRLNQNSSGDAVIDPSHIVFKFSGKDAEGRDMDVTANEMDGYSVVAF